ncbi:MAG: hypothetical protein KatS3mg129_0245 [Leptospiraceae bacterium]|nr:MAG: hypothetical protein KatS3mg129_0245 [Leptospiraceae bacterium]
MKQRWIDFQDAIYQLLDEVVGISYIDLCLNKIKEQIKNNKSYILVAEDISPLLYLKLPKPRGIILKKGSLSGHLSLLAANQGIPILVHAFPEEYFNQIQEGQWIVIDTTKGKATVFSDFFLKDKKFQIRKLDFDKKESITKDYNINDSNVIISLNVDDIDIIKEHQKKYQLSVGLFRTEFIYLKNPELLFDINKASEVYYNIYEQLRNNEILTLRLIDVDEDKFSYYFYTSPENRGKRGIDYYRAETNIIKNQIKSILKPLNKFNTIRWQLRIMIPMVATYDDWIFIKTLLYKELNNIKNEIKNQIKIGIMLEVPSILFSLPILEEEMDFYSVGTNDLLANFIGKRRNQITIEDYYEPSFFRMLYLALKDSKKEISICGNMATYLEFLHLFYFCGIRNFSVPYGIYPKIYDFFINYKENYKPNLIAQLLLKKTKQDFKEKLEEIISENTKNKNLSVL